MKKYKIELVEQEKVVKYESYVHELLTAAGFKRYLVTDLSTFSDFNLSNEDFSKLMFDFYLFAFEPTDCIWKIAEKLYKYDFNYNTSSQDMKAIIKSNFPDFSDFLEKRSKTFKIIE